LDQPRLAPERSGLNQLWTNGFFEIRLAPQARALFDEHPGHLFVPVARDAPDIGVLDVRTTMEEHSRNVHVRSGAGVGNQRDGRSAGHAGYSLVYV